MSGGMFDAMVTKAFDSVDKDKSGRIDRKELEVALNQFATDLKMDKVTSQDVEEYMKKLNKDKDEGVDKKEFGKLVQEMIAKKKK